MRVAILAVSFALGLSIAGFAEPEKRTTAGKATQAGKASGSGSSSIELEGKRTDHTIDTAKFQRELLEDLVIQGTNRQRTAAGLTKLRKSDRLTHAARTHSGDMAKRGYFGHDTKKLLRNGSFASRIKSEGYAPRGLAENIAMQPVVYRRTTNMNRGTSGRLSPQVVDDAHTYAGMAETVVQQWMGSPGHRRNIMDGALTHIGVGCAVGEKNGFPYIYFTQDFAAEVPE